jgi:hypothetical protein
MNVKAILVLTMQNASMALIGLTVNAQKVLRVFNVLLTQMNAVPILVNMEQLVPIGWATMNVHVHQDTLV